MKRETVAGISYIRRQSVGRRTPLILLHGIGSNAMSWEDCVNHLPSQFDVLAWDAPGYGDSRPIEPAQPTPHDYANALRCWLDVLGFERIYLAGHSLGCLFAGAFASLWPQRVAKVAFMSPALGYRVVVGAPLPASVQTRIDNLNQLGAAAAAARSAPRLLFMPETKPDVLARVLSAMKSICPAGYIQAVYALGAGDLLADAAKISASAAVFVGAEDVVTPVANAYALHKALPHSEPVMVMPGSGHALPQELPKQAARALSDFFEAG